jgi:hypothetical protein
MDPTFKEGTGVPLLTVCPSCDFSHPTATDTCARCGVVFAKLARPGREAYLREPEPAFAPAATVCQFCRRTAPVVDATFRQNVGALVARFEKRFSGNMCGACVNKHFWKCTLITMAVGWLGTISLILAPIYVITNIVAFFKAKSGLRRGSQPSMAAAAPLRPS